MNFSRFMDSMASSQAFRRQDLRFTLQIQNQDRSSVKISIYSARLSWLTVHGSYCELTGAPSKPNGLSRKLDGILPNNDSFCVS